MDDIIATKSGLIVREDERLGLVIYSPHTGLIFACEPLDKASLFRWLNRKTKTGPREEYIRALGPGWAISMSEADFPAKHLLPFPSARWSALSPTYPIVINWLITGNCLLKCRYCYADDVMKGRYEEPNEAQIIDIAETILSFRPLAVVLTGGDPLLSPYLGLVLQTLHRKTGIIVDTSGFSFDSDHIKLFRKYGIFVRISLDSEIPRINDALRQCRIKGTRAVNGSSKAAVAALCDCIDAGIGVSVQTVVSKLNRSDLETFGDKLFRLGVRSWRILLMTDSKAKTNEIKALRGSKSGQKRFDKYIEGQLRSKHERGWNKGMGVQITHNRSPNAVILVAPDGIFLTEEKVELGKVVLDDRYPRHPRLAHLFDKVDPHAHVERYLGL